MNKKSFTAVDEIKSSLLNLDLLITSVHTDLSTTQAGLGRYKDSKKKMEQRIYEGLYFKEKRLFRYLDALRQAQKECKDKINSLLETYYSNSSHRKIWYLHFIEEKTDDEIAEITCYDPNYIRKLIATFRKDLIELGYKTNESIV